MTREQEIEERLKSSASDREAYLALKLNAPADLRYLLDRIAELERGIPDEADGPPDPSYEEACDALADGRQPWKPK